MKHLLGVLVVSGVDPNSAFKCLNAHYPRLSYHRFAVVWNTAMHRHHGFE